MSCKKTSEFEVSEKTSQNLKGGSSQNGTAENVGEIATYTTTATDRFYNR